MITLITSWSMMLIAPSSLITDHSGVQAAWWYQSPPLQMLASP